ncbi:MAG: PhoH family protein [Thermodesulfobacteriota bacterium]
MKQKETVLTTQKELSFPDNETASRLYGELNSNLKVIEKSAEVTLQTRGTDISISGREDDVELAAATLKQLYNLIEAGYPLYAADIAYALKVMERSLSTDLKKIFLDKVYITASNQVISPKSINQKKYIDIIRTHDIVFGIGPAGTGKTYLGVAMAIAAFSSDQVRSIILARPAIEAGEKLGFLPGDMAEKVNPYLRPLHDALNDMLRREKTLSLLESGHIEIAPLAFMRGRTLNNAFVILDEAQNTTPEQMKMFLTRLGFNSKAVITGDVTQTDLPPSQISGLDHANRILKEVKGIASCYFNHKDVVRHPLVQKIIKAYETKTRTDDNK